MEPALQEQEFELEQHAAELEWERLFLKRGDK